MFCRRKSCASSIALMYSNSSTTCFSLEMDLSTVILYVCDVALACNYSTLVLLLLANASYSVDSSLSVDALSCFCAEETTIYYGRARTNFIF